MIICFFGTYDRQYSRNRMLLAGLEKLKVPVVEVHSQLRQIVLNNKKHVGILPMVHRLARKFVFLPVVVKNFFRIRRSDAILCAYPGHVDLPLAWIVAKLARKPLIFDPLFSLTDVFVNDFTIVPKGSWKGNVFQRIESLLFRLPDVILADTPFQKENYHRLFGIPVSSMAVVPLGADNTLYQPSKKEPDPKGKFRVIYYGLYNPVHGVEYIVEAAKLLAGDSDIEFLFIGDGQTYQHAVDMAATYKLKNIQFLKLKEHDAIPMLQTADIFLGLFGKSNTVWRTIPNKVLQGMAMGKAVITGDGAALRSIFTHRRHLFIVPPEHPVALAAAIQELKTNDRLRKTISGEGQALFLKEFTPEAVARQFVNVLQHIYQPSH